MPQRPAIDEPDALERAVSRIPREIRIIVAVLFAAFALQHHATATLDREEGPGRGDISLADIRDAGIFPARAWLEGVNPYDRVTYRAYDARIGQDFPVYSPVHIVLHLPFAQPPVEGARVAYYWVSLWLIAGLSVLTLRAAGRRVTLESSAMLFGVFLWSHPGALSLVSGQSGPVLAIAGLLALTATTPLAVVAGVVLALSKPIFGVPLLVMLWARGRARSAVVGSVVAVAISALVLVRLLGDNTVRDIVDGFGNNLDVTARIGSGKRVDLASTFARVTDTSPPLTFELGVAAVVIAIVALIVRRAWLVAPASDVGLALALCTPSLVFFHGSWDLITTIPAVILLLRPDPGRVLDDRLRWFVVALLTYAIWNPWGRRFSEGLYDDRLTGVLASTARSACFTLGWAVLVGAALWRSRGWSQDGSISGAGMTVPG